MLRLALRSAVAASALVMVPADARAQVKGTEPPPVATPGAITATTPARPVVFEGTAGSYRAAGYLLALAGAGAGSMLAALAQGAANDASSVAASLVQKGGSYACNHVPAAQAMGCGYVVKLWQQRDALANAAEGSFIGAGVLAVVSTVSIWIVRTPSGSAALKPTAGGGPGLTVQGTW